MALSFITTNPAGAEPNTLRFKLHKALRSARPGRDLGTIHASDLTKSWSFCGRARLIQRLKQMKPPTEWATAADRATWDFGHAIQEVATNWFVEAGMAVGDWKCIGCSHLHSMQYRPVVCTQCGSKHFRHVERRFVSQQSGISCGIDLFVSGMGPKLRTLEIKSIMKDDFVKLAGPLQEHKLRTKLYLRLVQESGDEDRHKIDPDTGHVLYICKGGYSKDAEVDKWKLGDRGFTPFKDYIVQRNDAETDGLCTQPASYKQALETGIIPAGICVSQFDAPAKSCSVCGDCFSGKYPIGSKFV